MAGSYSHVTCTKKGETKRQFVGNSLIDHLGDALEAEEEMWFMIHYLAGDDNAKIDAANQAYYASARHETTDPLAVELQDRLRDARDNEYWEGRLDEVMED